MAILLTRDAFREAVFKRDGHACVICKKPAIDESFYTIIVCLKFLYYLFAKTIMDIHKLFERYNEGVEIEKITNEFQISEATFYRLQKKHNIPKRKFRLHRKSAKYINLTGQTFGFIKINEIKFEPLYSDNTYFAHCECLNCGNKDYKVRPYDLVKGKVKSCGCLNSGLFQKTGKDNKMFTGYEDISGQRWAEIKCGAQKRKLVFNISIQDGWKQFILQNKKCSFTGQELFFGESNSKRGNASLDRIDSSKGYTIDNIQWVHKDVNKMKSDFTSEYLVQLCKMICKHSI